MSRTSVSGKPQLNRKINISIILDLLKRHGSSTRADLAKLTGIRAASISAIVQQLVDEKLIVETGLGQSTGGRQPTMLALNPSGLHTVGIEVEENGLNGILVDFTGTVLEKLHVPLSTTKPATVINKIVTVVNKLCACGQVCRDDLAGIGIALPGIINMGEGRIILSRPLGWRNVALKEKLSSRLDLEVRVVKNALAGALAAYFDQGEPMTRSLLFVLVHFLQPLHDRVTPLGCGIVLDGRAYLGDGHRAGEIHLDIEHPLARARSRFGKSAPKTVQELAARSIEKPEDYASIWDPFAAELGAVVSRGLDFLNPGKVTIGTDIPEAEALVGAGLRTVAQAGILRDREAATGLIEDFPPAPIQFMTMEMETLAKGAVVPQLQELSLAPSLRSGVLL